MYQITARGFSVKLLGRRLRLNFLSRLEGVRSGVNLDHACVSVDPVAIQDTCNMVMIGLLNVNRYKKDNTYLYKRCVVYVVSISDQFVLSGISVLVRCYS